MSADADAKEANLRKKLNGLHSEMLKFGTIKGFKYFLTYMRGREEMMISVMNELQSSSSGYISESIYLDNTNNSNKNISNNSGDFTSHKLPYDKRSLLLSQRTQLLLSTHGEKGIGLPPASPSDQESFLADGNSTLFLLAGYSRYNNPYVWVRSNHERLANITKESADDRDCPLRLKSTLKWAQADIQLWDVIAELVKLCTYPAPINPFALDFEYFTSLPVEERILATAGMINILQKIILHIPDEKIYAGQVLEELQLLTKEHFQSLKALLDNKGLPVLSQYIQKQQALQQPRRRNVSGSRSYLKPSHNMGTVQPPSPTVTNERTAYTTYTSADGPFPYGQVPSMF